jgi:ABC-2 type transport system permease protein
VSAHSGSRAAPAARAVLAQTGMELRLLLRSSESLVVTLGIPLGILVFFSAVDVLPTGDQRPVEFLVPGVLAISVMSTAFVAIAIQTAFERKYGVLKRLGATPLSRTRYLAAKALAVLAVLAVQTVLVLAIATFGLGWEAGAQAQTDPTRVAGPALGLVAGGMLLGAAAFTALGLAMAGALRAEATLALSNAVFLLLLLVSGVAVDLDELPAALANVALFTPSGALAAVLRDGLYPADVALWPLSLLVLAAWGVGATVLAARTFRWEP